MRERLYMARKLKRLDGWGPALLFLLGRYPLAEWEITLLRIGSRYERMPPPPVGGPTHG